MNIKHHDLRKLRAACCFAEWDAKYNMSNPYLDVEEKVLVATDGHILVAFPVELEAKETSGPVPLLALELVAKLAEEDEEDDDITPPKITIECRERVRVRRGKDEVCSYPRPAGEFPNWKPVIPSPGEKPPITFVNARLLLAVQEALGSDGIGLWVEDSRAAILVGNEGGGFAVVMPMRHGMGAPPALAAKLTEMSKR